MAFNRGFFPQKDSTPNSSRIPWLRENARLLIHLVYTRPYCTETSRRITEWAFFSQSPLLFRSFSASFARLCAWDQALQKPAGCRREYWGVCYLSRSSCLLPLFAATFPAFFTFFRNSLAFFALFRLGEVYSNYQINAIKRIQIVRRRMSWN